MFINALKSFFLSFIFIITAIVGSRAVAQAPSIKWQKTFGGTNDDVATDMRVTTDKGFIVVGYSKSNKTGSKTDSSYNNTNDFWIIRLDSNGNKVWDKTYGGSNVDQATAVIQTSDQGFLIGGNTLSPISGNKTDSVHFSSPDYWVIKLDKNGIFKWQKTIGGNYTEKLSCLAEVSTGYLLGGISYSDKGGDKKSANFGSENSPDFWVVKVGKTSGGILATQSNGSTNDDFMTGIYATTSNSTLAGSTYSPARGSKTSRQVGVSDYWLCHTDTKGNQLWEKTFGGLSGDYLTSMEHLTDSGYILGGYSSSPALYDKSQPSFGFSDYWLVRTDSSGNKLWDRTIGGDMGDYMQSMTKTTDNGFLLGGYSNSNAGNSKSAGTFGSYDYWIVKVDSLGNQQWDQTLGGGGTDKLAAVRQISAGEYIVAGTSNSGISGNKTTDTIGGSDIWIVRLSTNQAMLTSSITNTVSNTLSINNPVQNTNNLLMNVVPNPVRTNVNINYSSAGNAKLSLSLMNNEGKILFTKTLAPGAGTYNINAAKLPAGIYYAVLQSGTSTVTRAVVKQ